MDDQTYLAMEYVPGETLLEKLRTHPEATKTQAIDILEQMLDALACVLGAHLVHRDIKPSNIMIRPDGRAMLMDFGLVRDLSTDAARLTGQGDLLGTPKFVAPEVFHGESATPSSDLWSLGAVVYQLLTGSLPFDAPTFEAYLSVVVGSPDPQLDAQSAGVPEATAHFIDRLLRKDPSERFADATQALGAFCIVTGRTIRRPSRTSLEAINDHGSVGTPRTRKHRRYKRSLRRAALPAAAAVAGAFIALLAVHPPLGLSTPGQSRGPESSASLEASRSRLLDPTRSGLDRNSASQDLKEALQRMAYACGTDQLCAPDSQQPEESRIQIVQEAGTALHRERLQDLLTDYRQSRQWVPTSEALGVYREGIPLLKFDFQLRALGYHLPVAMDLVLPPWHRPLVSAPPGPQTVILWTFNEEVTALESAKDPDILVRKGTDQDLVLWIRGAGFPGGMDLMDMVQQRVIDQYVSPEFINLPAPLPNQKVFLRATLRSLGEGETLDVTLLDAQNESPAPITLFGSGRDQGSTGPLVPHLHGIDPTLVGGKRKIKLKYEYCERLGMNGEVWVGGIAVVYVRSE